MVGSSIFTRHSTEALGTISHSTFSRCSCALFALGNPVRYFHSALVSDSLFFSVRVLFGSTGELDFGGEDAVHGSFWKNFTHFQREVHALHALGILDVIFSSSTCLAASDGGRLVRRKKRPFFGLRPVRSQVPVAPTPGVIPGVGPLFSGEGCLHCKHLH